MSKFKVGDKVKILDGSNIKNYTDSWCGLMYKHVGEVHTITEDKVTGGYILDIEGICKNCVWDERGLELARQSASKFKVGDRVIGNAKANEHYGYTRKGWIGTVTEVFDKNIWDEDFKAIGPGITDKDVAFKLNSKYFDLYVESSQKIVITTDGKTTSAVLYDGKKRIKDAKAICSPDDTFDFGIGSALALERLIGNSKATLPEDEKSEYFNGKVRCIKVSPINGKMFTQGKIYQFVDGYSTDNQNEQFPFTDPLKSVEELNRRIASDFEEVIEEGFLNARICIINGHSSSQFKAGEIYNIKEGKILGTQFPYHGKIKDFDDLKYYFCSNSKKDELKHSENLGHHCFDGVEYKVLSSLDWNKFTHGKFEVKVSREKFDEFMQLCEKKNFTFADNMPATKGNPWKLFDKLPELCKALIKTIGGTPSEHIYVSTDKDGNLQWDNDHDKDIDEYEFV